MGETMTESDPDYTDEEQSGDGRRGGERAEVMPHVEG